MNYLEIAHQALSEHRAKAPVVSAAASDPSTVPDTTTLIAAVATLNREGVRRFQLDGIATIGIWKDADTVDVRATIGALYPQGIQVVHLDDDRVPGKYKVRKPKQITERETADEPRISWHEWKARMLNEIFETQGATGRSSNITAEDVRRGEAAKREGGTQARNLRLEARDRGDDRLDSNRF